MRCLVERSGAVAGLPESPAFGGVRAVCGVPHDQRLELSAGGGSTGGGLERLRRRGRGYTCPLGRVLPA